MTEPPITTTHYMPIGVIAEDSGDAFKRVYLTPFKLVGSDIDGFHLEMNTLVKLSRKQMQEALEIALNLIKLKSHT
jgi:hypothetical protein